MASRAELVAQAYTSKNLFVAQNSRRLWAICANIKDFLEKDTVEVSLTHKNVSWELGLYPLKGLAEELYHLKVVFFEQKKSREWTAP